MLAYRVTLSIAILFWAAAAATVYDGVRDFVEWRDLSTRGVVADATVVSCEKKRAWTGSRPDRALRSAVHGRWSVRLAHGANAVRRHRAAGLPLWLVEALIAKASARSSGD
jgi:hypothetical protein